MCQRSGYLKLIHGKVFTQLITANVSICKYIHSIRLLCRCGLPNKDLVAYSNTCLAGAGDPKAASHHHHQLGKSHICSTLCLLLCTSSQVSNNFPRLYCNPCHHDTAFSYQTVPSTVSVLALFLLQRNKEGHQPRSQGLSWHPQIVCQLFSYITANKEKHEKHLVKQYFVVLLDFLCCQFSNFGVPRHNFSY